MNLSEYLKESKKDNEYKIHKSYVEVTDGISIPNFVKIDNVLDIIGSGVIQAEKIHCIINVCRSIWVNYNNLMPGSYVNNHVYDTSGSIIVPIYVNGYVMNNGVLS